MIIWMPFECDEEFGFLAFTLLTLHSDGLGPDLVELGVFVSAAI